MQTAGLQSCGRHLCGQSSLEALLSLAALLCALSILIFSAQKLSSHFSDSIQASSGRISLAASALALDSAAQLSIPLEADANLSAVSFPGGSAILSSSRSSIRDTLMHNASAGIGGRVYVQKNIAVPV